MGSIKARWKEVFKILSFICVQTVVVTCMLFITKHRHLAFKDLKSTRHNSEVCHHLAI